MKKRLMAAVLSTAMAATMLLTGSISVQAADAAAANDPAVELIFTSVSVSGDSIQRLCMSLQIKLRNYPVVP